MQHFTQQDVNNKDDHALMSWSVRPSIYLSVYLSVCLSVYSPYEPWPLFQFLNPYTVGRTPWKGDQPVAKPLPTYRTTQTQNKRTHRHPCLQPTIQEFRQAKTVHATVIGSVSSTGITNFPSIFYRASLEFFPLRFLLLELLRHSVFKHSFFIIVCIYIYIYI
jgi:hypothetical protein